jgi:hypothetical protein
MVIANSVTNEFVEALPDCYEAVEEKGGTIPAEQTAANLPDAIESIPTGGGYTGHVDEVGLRAIGWIDRDIEWLKSVKDWNEEDDDLYKVPQELIDAYISAGNTWSEALSQTNSAKWWFIYRPRGGERQQFANNEICLFLKYVPNYETWPWTEMRAWGYGAKGVVINNVTVFNYMNMWNSSPSIIQVNTTAQILGGWGFMRNNSQVREIRGILDCSQADFSDTSSSLNSCSGLSVIWIKNLNTNVRIKSRCLSKECILYMINNALTANAITITLDQYVYQYGGMSTDADVLAALANHPNVTLAQG